MRVSAFHLPAMTSAAIAIVSGACSTTEASPVDAPAPSATVTAPAAEDASAPTPPAQADASPLPDPFTRGCALVPAGAGAIMKLATSAAGKARSYHLAVPAGATAKQPLALVFVLHGAGDTAPENMHDWFDVGRTMTTSPLSVYPQALARTRADGSGGEIPRWDLEGDDDLSFFDAMLASISDAYCVDRARVFVTGFSSGGNFSQNLACLRQKAVKGMAVVAGPGPFAETCGGAVPVWMTHDLNDDALPVAGARGSRDFWAAQNGCQKSTWTAVLDRAECKRNTSCPAGAPLVYCETTGVGHDLPAFAVSAIGQFFAAVK